MYYNEKACIENNIQSKESMIVYFNSLSVSKCKHSKCAILKLYIHPGSEPLRLRRQRDVGDMMGKKGDLCYGSSMDSHPVALAKENTVNLIRVGQVKDMRTLSGK